MLKFVFINEGEKYPSFILQILEIQEKYALSGIPKKKYKWSIKIEKNNKLLCLNTSIILYLYFLTFVEMKYTSSILLSLKRNTFFRKSTSNMSVLNVRFKYTSAVEYEYINLESLLQVYIWVSK